MNASDAPVPPRESRSRHTRAWHGVVLVALVLFAHATSIDGEFVGDDHAAIEQNVLVRGPLDLVSIATTNYWWGYREQLSSLYRPVTVLSHHVVHRLGGGSVPVHRAVNVALHLAVVFEILALVPILVGVRRWGFVAAALFAVHPVLVEPIALVVGRADLLAALLALEAWRLARRGTRVCSSLAVIAALAACCAKESAFPLVLVAGAAQVVQGEGDVRARIASALPLGFALVLAMAIRVAVLGGVGYPGPPPFSDNPLFHLELSERLRGGLAVAANYVRLVAYPRVLSADYSFDQIPVPPVWLAFPPIVGVAALAALAAIAARWRRPAAVAALLVLVTYAPVANLLIPIRTVAGERLLYIPMIGLCALAAIMATRASRIAPRGTVAVIVLAVLLLGGRSALRGLDWKKDFTLTQVTAQTSPRSWRAHTAYARVLSDGGRLDVAAGELERALQIDPRVAENHRALARLARERGDLAAAREWLIAAARAQPGDLWVTLDLAFVDLDLARSDADVRAALQGFDRVAEEAGSVPSVRIGRARAWLQLGEADRARVELHGLLEERPDRAADLVPVLARVELARGRPEDALAALVTQDRGVPDPELDSLRAEAWEQMGRIGQARAAWLRAMLANERGGRELVELARLAVRPDSTPPVRADGLDGS